MGYKVLGKSLYDVPEEEREARDESIMDTLLAHMKGRETVVAVDVWGYKDLYICDGGYVWDVLGDTVDSLAIKDGCDLIRYENGNLGLVAYYNGRESYLEIITDEDEVARIKVALDEED